MTPQLLAFCALLVAAASFCYGIFIYISMRRMMDVTHGRTRGGNQTLADLATLKREVGLLSETVTRFRTQSLAGITESISEQERQLKNNLQSEFNKELTGLSNEFDRALKAVVDRFDRKQTELLKDLESIAQIDQLRNEVESLKYQLSQGEGTKTAPDLSAYARASVQDRFIASLESAEDRRKCLLSSLDTVLDIPTLGKLAVAYPSVNSWMLLKELADHGVVSDVAGWALLAGAELSFAGNDHKLAEQLYQAARLSFAIGGKEDHEGLFFVSGGLARVLNEAGREEVAQALAMGCDTHLETLKSAPPLEPGLSCFNLAEYYLQDERYACASILYMRTILLCRLLSYNGDHCNRAWAGLNRALRFIVRAQAASEKREQFSYFGPEIIEFLSSGLNAPDSPLKEAAEKEGVLLCLLHLSERESDANTALATIVALMNQLESGRLSKDHKSFLAAEVLSCLDEMGLSRKAVGLPILKQLVDVFSKAGNYTKAASAGAKLVDVSLDLFGDASLETVAPIELLARVYKAMERFDLAEECYRQILEVQYKVYPSEHEHMIDVLLSLAEVCLIQHDQGESEIFMESAQEMCVNLFEDVAINSEDGQNNYMQEDDTDRKQKAERIHERIDGLKAQMASAAS